jgi:hypothetical protein
MVPVPDSPAPPADLPDLTDAEQLVWDAFPEGSWVDLRAGNPGDDDPGRAAGWGPERVVRAQVLRALLLGARRPEPGSAPGIRLRGARISERLDLIGASTAWPLVCEYCSFDSEVRLVEAVTKTVRITHSALPGLNATRIRLDGILNLWHSHIDGLVRLDQARVTGQVCLRGAEAGKALSGAEAVAANGLAIEGTLDCDQLTAHGLVSLQVAKITGSADFNGARLTNHGGQALSADSAEIGGRLHFRGMVAEGEVSLHNAKVAASVSFDHAKLSNPAGQALSAGGMVVGAGVHLAGGFESKGEVRLLGAQLSANLTLAGASLHNPGGIAINADRATIGVCNGIGLTCAGRFSLTGAQFASGLDLSGAVIEVEPGERAMTGDGATVLGMLSFRRLKARGELSFRSLKVGRDVLMMHAELANEGGVACRFSGADIAGDLIGLHLSMTGGMRLTGTRIGGRLNLDQVKIRNPGSFAITARALTANQFSLVPAEPVAGAVDLSHARIGIFRDDPACWPDQLSLDGLTYDTLEPRLPAADRLRWLAKDPGGALSQPYEYLAAHYTRIGQPEEARTVMYEREREQRRDANAFVRFWSVIQDVTLGYGYRPWRALVWLAVLLIGGSITFGLWPPPAFDQAAAPHFNAVIYTLDLLLPLVGLGQKNAFNPGGAEQWLSYVLIAAGWILVTTVAAAAARVLRRG